MDDKIIKSKIIANCPIVIEGMGKIHTLKLKEIVEFNEDEYFKTLSILTSNIDDLKVTSLPQEFTYFDYIVSICYNNENKKNQIIKFLEYVFKEEIHFLPNNLCFCIGKYKNTPANEVHLLDKDNFEIFIKILRIQNGIKNTPKKIKQGNEKINPKVEKLNKIREKGRKNIEKASGGEFSLENLISSLGVFLLDIEKALELNIYQANNLYEKLLRKEKFHTDLKAYLAGADIKNLSINKHWTTVYVPPTVDEREIAPSILKN